MPILGSAAAQPERISGAPQDRRSEEHTSELQSRPHLVCRLLLEKKKKKRADPFEGEGVDQQAEQQVTEQRWSDKICVDENVCTLVAQGRHAADFDCEAEITRRS